MIRVLLVGFAVYVLVLKADPIPDKALTNDESEEKDRSGYEEEKERKGDEENDDSKDGEEKHESDSLVGSRIAVGIQSGLSSTCRYWCKTNFDQYYCCEHATDYQQQPISFPIVKPGYCPPQRFECPDVQRIFEAPRPCSSDGSCLGIDKCCYDVCLQHHVCKPPQYYYAN